MEISPNQIGGLLQTFGFPTAALALVVWAFLTEHVVPGAACKRIEAERDKALELLNTKATENERELASLRARYEERTDGRARRLDR